MTQVNFYALGSGQESDKWEFACRLTEKIVALDHRVFIRVASDQQGKLLDDLLWTFKPASFLPHALLGRDKDREVAALVGVGDCPAEATDVLINLCSDACGQHRQFSRISEIIMPDEESLKAGRSRYRYYKTQGYQLTTHRI